MTMVEEALPFDLLGGIAAAAEAAAEAAEMAMVSVIATRWRRHTSRWQIVLRAYQPRSARRGLGR